MYVGSTMCFAATALWYVPLLTRVSSFFVPFFFFFFFYEKKID